MCAKRERRCAEALQLREEALQEWCEADSLSAVLACWGRLGGRVTLHRYGREFYREIGKKGGASRRLVLGQLAAAS